MDIAAISTSSSQYNLQTQVSVSVLSMGIDMIEQTGQGLIKLMEQSVQPNLGSNLDISI